MNKTDGHKIIDSSFYYSAISSGYSELHSEEQVLKYNAVLTLPEIKSCFSILDVGCGSGMLSDFWPLPKLYTGIDVAYGMLGMLPKMHGAGIQGAGKGFVLGAAEYLPFASKSFDIVACFTAIHNFAEPSAALLEMKRVARNSVVVSVLKRSARAGIIGKIITGKFRKCRILDSSHDMIYVCFTD